MVEKPKIVVITGPTATGKTDAAIDFALEHGGEIISADSMLVYRRMNIGTAKPTPEQMAKVRHHMVDVAEPSENFSAAKWRDGALSAIYDILGRGKLPVLAGGTGLYIRAALYPMEFGGSDGGGFEREKWEKYLAENGAEALHQRLAETDPQSAMRLPIGDTRRIIRALEVFDMTGETMTERIAADEKREPLFSALVMGVNLPREILYGRVNRRVDIMLENGLIREVEGLLAEGVPREATSMQGLGYKEIAAYIDGRLTLDEAIETLKRRTRNFAKRQVTWFKKYGGVRWLDAREECEKADILTFFNENYISFMKSGMM